MFRFNFCQLSKWSKLKNEYHLPLIVAKQRAQQTDAKQSSIAPSTEDNKKLAGRNESSTKALEMCHSFWQDSSQPLALNDCKNMVRFSIQPIKMMVIALKDMGAFESGVSLRKRLVNLLSEFYCHGLKCQDNFIVTANMMTTFAKIGTLSGTKEEKDTIDAFVSTPFLHRIVQDSMRFAAASRECTNYFLLLRALFRSIGTHDLLYQQFLPLLPSIVQQNRLQNGAHRQSVHELFVELCLTIPVRLSSLLPYLPLLMDPLVCALNGSPALVQQGLRTLELCVDQKSASLHGVCILFRGDRLLNSRIQFCRSYCSSTRNVEDEFEKAELRLRANLAEKNTIFYFALVSAIMIVFVVILNNLTDLKIGFAGLAGKVDTLETSVAHLAGKVDTIESTLKTLVRMNGGGKTENGSEKKTN